MREWQQSLKSGFRPRVSPKTLLKFRIERNNGLYLSSFFFFSLALPVTGLLSLERLVLMKARVGRQVQLQRNAGHASSPLAAAELITDGALT